MNFKEEVIKRLESGKKYNDEWNEWDGIRFLKEAQEELVDCYNYLKKYTEKYQKLNPLIGMLMSACRTGWHDLEEVKRKHELKTK